MDTSTDPYRLLVEHFPDGIAFIYEERDGELRYTFVGGEGLQEIGLTKAELEGSPVAEGRPPEIRDRIRARYRDALAGSRVTFDVEAEGRHFRFTVSPMAGEGQEAATGIGIARDVTEQTVYREELERQNQRLEKFMQLVFHDLRNPLTVAMARLEQLEAECDSEQVGPLAEALDRIEALTREDATMLDERDPEDLVAIDLDAVATAAWNNVATKDARLRVDVDRTVRADEGDLRRVFENLFRNSVEHGSEGVTVTVDALPVGFYVADDGPGIPPELRETVFERGYSSAERGTGLGLVVVKSVVEGHGWRIDVAESEPGGARFEITGVDA